ncbi:tumor necrosis factor receptor superfamily member 6 isoform X2 [Megalobrama amblycephala]|uniref:tumor necrosis factor receptor superfamily member 6 isoform X2 n=1 Tax=Megalobrama amblycephala TaxID=75352 RepID=UPI00201412C7|nr:tumor necrosis factor receptor superfamily member 6 isoform X2 [Megalobrama amblycephala]
MYVNLVLLFCVIFVSDGRRLRRRSADCDEGPYQHEGKTCCLCPKGYRVLSHCTDRNGTKCQLCDDGTYMDHPNSDLSCLPCKICNPNANMKVKVRCSEYSNTVCGCLEDHYCDKGDHCKFCKACGKCENEVKTKCTETNNTVCEDATPKSSETTAIVVPIVVLIIIIVVGVVLFIIYKRRQEMDKPVPKEEEKFLQDIDIYEYLPEICEHLSWKVMKRVAQHSGMTAVTIENHESNYPADPTQRTDGLLRDWYQAQGLYKAYPALIKSLCAIKERTVADKIKQIVEKGEAKKRDIHGTGHVQS